MKIAVLSCAAMGAAMLIAVPPARAAGESGTALFKRSCAGCHGANGAGQTAMGKRMKIRDLRSEEVQKQSDTELYDLIAKGKGKMPAYEKKLTKPQIEALVTHIRSLAKGEAKGEARSGEKRKKKR